MYERNAIILERYFNQMFGYNMKNNIKTNFKDYSELVECLEEYKDTSDEEETIMQEYDSIANKIREIQRKQETLNKKSSRYQEERENIFQNIDESAEVIQKKLDDVNDNIQDLNEEIRENSQQFVEVIAEFSEKSSIRTVCGRKRRNVESEYNKKLNETLDNYKDIDMSLAKNARQFIELDTFDIEEELKAKIKKNGEKEKIPFNIDVITKAIALCVDIQKRETDILASIYDRTNKLFVEIKNNAVKNDKHKKAIKDSKNKLEFVSAIKEYLVQFLDNERLTAVNGQEEHDKLMKEACKNLDEDLVQINNLYTLLLKEISKKITKKSYNELYNAEYLQLLEAKTEKFEMEVKKLNLPVTVINPNYWRIEGMKKIYDVFYKCVTEEYDRDLTEYITHKKTKKNIVDIEEEDEEEEENEEFEEKELQLEKKKTRQIKIKKEPKLINKEKDVKAEIDKKIDMILGFEEDDWEEEEEEEDFEEDFEEDLEEDFEDEEWEEDIDEESNNDEDWEEDEDYENFEDENDIEEDDEDEADFDIWGNNLKENNSVKKNEEDDDWENEFINIDKREKNKKKKGFFDKFKK